MRARSRGGSVSGADHGADGGHEVAALGGELLDLEERLVEVLLHVVAERLEGRDVEDLGALGEGSGEGLADQRVDAGEEGGEGFAAAGGGGDEGVAAGKDVRPAGNLRLGGRAEAREKPFAHDGMRPGEMVVYGCGSFGVGSHVVAKGLSRLHSHRHAATGAEGE